MDFSVQAQALVNHAARDLPPLPAVIHKLLETTAKESVSAHEIEDILSHDSALAVKTLRVVNSAYYGLPRQVRNLGQAVVILGVHQVQTLALGLAALDVLGGDKALESQLEAIWRHSLETSVASSLVARHLHLDRDLQEQASIVGLLHDLGRLLLLSYFTGPYLELNGAAHSPLALLDKFRVDQYEIGAALLDRWKLPVSLCLQIGDLSNPWPNTKVAQAVAIAHSFLLGEELPITECEFDFRSLKTELHLTMNSINESYGLEAA